MCVAACAMPTVAVTTHLIGSSNGRKTLNYTFQWGTHLFRPICCATENSETVLNVNWALVFFSKYFRPLPRSLIKHRNLIIIILIIFIIYSMDWLLILKSMYLCVVSGFSIGPPNLSNVFTSNMFIACCRSAALIRLALAFDTRHSVLQMGAVYISIHRLSYVSNSSSRLLSHHNQPNINLHPKSLK